VYTTRRKPMNTVGIKQLRDNLSKILRMVENGKVVTISRHGREVVQLKPVENNREKELLIRLREKHLSQGAAGKIGAIRTVKNRKPENPVSDLVIEERR
jgi:prevent-host-death family protein